MLRWPPRKACLRDGPRQARGLPGRGRGEPSHPCPGSEVIFPPCRVGEGAPRGTDPVPSQHLGQPSAFQGAPGDLAVCESPKAPGRLKAPPATGPPPPFPERGHQAAAATGQLCPPPAPPAAAACFPAEGTCTNIDLKTLMRQDRASWELPPRPSCWDVLRERPRPLRLSTWPSVCHTEALAQAGGEGRHEPSALSRSVPDLVPLPRPHWA